MILIAFMVSLGSVAKVWVSAWGALLLLGVVGVGILWPLRLHTKQTGAANAAMLVLVGGFLLRLVTLLASGGIEFHRVAEGVVR